MNQLNERKRIMTTQRNSEPNEGRSREGTELRDVVIGRENTKVRNELTNQPEVLLTTGARLPVQPATMPVCHKPPLMSCPSHCQAHMPAKAMFSCSSYICACFMVWAGRRVGWVGHIMPATRFPVTLPFLFFFFSFSPPSSSPSFYLPCPAFFFFFFSSP